MPINSINEVIHLLNNIISHCKQRNSRAGYFAALYKRMTVAVKEGINKGVFEDGPRMEKLDICFAERYINAWNAYQQKIPCTQSWQFAFDCVDNADKIVLQHLLLGINTHINLDLAIAAATIAPGNNIFNLEKDFKRINSIIANLVDDVQECLSQIWIPMRLLVKVAGGSQYKALNFSVDKARDAAWANALLLANMNELQQGRHVQTLDGLVKKLALGIADPGIKISFLLKLIRNTEYDDTARTIHLIETVVV